MPKTHSSRVLAIDPGTHKMGVAVLEGGELIYHGVLVIGRHSSPHGRLKECRQLVLRLIRDFEPKTLAVEKAFFSNNRNSALLNVLVDEIRAIGRRKRLVSASYAPSSVKKFITGSGRASKEAVARVVVARFPQLKVYLDQDRQWKDRHHQNMFDAVALGLMNVGSQSSASRRRRSQR